MNVLFFGKLLNKSVYHWFKYYIAKNVVIFISHLLPWCNISGMRVSTSVAVLKKQTMNS